MARWYLRLMQFPSLQNDLMPLVQVQQSGKVISQDKAAHNPREYGEANYLEIHQCLLPNSQITQNDCYLPLNRRTRKKTSKRYFHFLPLLDIREEKRVREVKFHRYRIFLWRVKGKGWEHEWEAKGRVGGWVSERGGRERGRERGGGGGRESEREREREERERERERERELAPNITWTQTQIGSTPPHQQSQNASGKKRSFQINVTCLYDDTVSHTQAPDKASTTERERERQLI